MTDHDDQLGTIRYCARGCKRTLQDKTRVPVRATTGNLCRSCTEHLQDWLAEIPERYALLPTYLLPTADLDRNPESQATKRPTAPVPVRLAALDLLDDRLGHRTIDRDGWIDTIPGDERRGTIGTLLAIANEIREVRGSDRLTNSHVITEAGYIRDGIPVLAASTGIVDIYAELRTLHRQLGDAIGQYPPRPVGECPEIPDGLTHDEQTCSCEHHQTGDDCEDDCFTTWNKANACGGPLLPMKLGGVVCVTCSHKWDETLLRWLGRNLEAAS